MNAKLQAWLDSLPGPDREKVISLLGDLATETEEDRSMSILRKAAGLPEESPKKKPNVGDIARRAAGLPDKE